MNRHDSQFHHEEEEHTESRNTTESQKNGIEFSSPEEMIRYDASQTKIPPDIARRLQEAAAEEARRQSWWQRLWNRP